MEGQNAKSKNVHGRHQKLENIAEILALLDERKKGKEWIFQELKSHRLKLNVKRTMNSFEILKACPDEFVSHLLARLHGDDLEDFEDVDTLSKTYHWFFVDIVASAKPTMVTTDQLRKIVVLNKLVGKSHAFMNRDKDSTLVLPTGDGMAIGFGDSPEKPLLLAIDLHKAVARYNNKKTSRDKLVLRIGLDMGPVYSYKDVLGNENVWGSGIIMARRVMDLCGDMQIFASGRISENIRKLAPNYKEIFHQVGDYSIKHGEQIPLYNVYGNGFGRRYPPRKGKVIKQKKTGREQSGINTFAFSEIDIGLEITKPKTMLVHHIVKWHVTNISKEPKSQVFYYLDGDCPKDFSELGVKVTDERANVLDIAEVSVNKPYHKEFNVILKKPLKPKSKKTVLKLEYDWEEPDRNYFYKLATDCKKFTYRCKVPKGIPVENKVLKVDTEMGYKWLVDPPPRIKYGKDYTEILWDAKNLNAYDAYKFQW